MRNQLLRQLSCLPFAYLVTSLALAPLPFGLASESVKKTKKDVSTTKQLFSLLGQRTRPLSAEELEHRRIVRKIERIYETAQKRRPKLLRRSLLEEELPSTDRSGPMQTKVDVFYNDRGQLRAMKIVQKTELSLRELDLYYHFDDVLFAAAERTSRFNRPQSLEVNEAGPLRIEMTTSRHLFDRGKMVEWRKDKISQPHKAPAFNDQERRVYSEAQVWLAREQEARKLRPAEPR